MFLYAALFPNGRLWWLLPLVALFHVSIAGLMFALLVAAELAASLRRRSVSLALVMSLLCLIGAALRTGLESYNPVVPPRALSLALLAARIDPVTLLPGLVILAVLAVAAWVVWRQPDPRGDLLLRAVVIAAALACAGQLNHALVGAGVSTMDPAAFNFILLSYYLAPGVCAAGIFLVVFAVGARAGATLSSFDVDNRVLSSLMAGLLALAAARAGDAVNRLPVTAVARGAALVVTQEAPRSAWPPLVLDAGTPDDRYRVGPSVGDAVTAMTLLKLKLRSVTGLLRLDQASFEASQPRP
jgi:hypothetical protein